MSVVAAKIFEPGVGGSLKPASIIVMVGDNAQLKSDIFRSIMQFCDVKVDDPFRLVNLDSDALERDPGLLADELGSISMFGGSRLIRAFVQPRQCERILDVARAAARGGWVLVIDTDDVSESNWLGSVRSAADEMIVLCSAEKAGDFRTFVRSECSRANLRIGEQAIDALILLAGDDRAGVRGEIEKLLLLHGEARDITVEDIRDIVADASSMLADDVAAAVLSGDPARAAAAIDRLSLSGSDPTQALGAALRHALAIHRNHAKQWSSRSDGASATMTAADARALTRSLQSAVLQTRSDGALATLAAERSLVALGYAVRNRRRT